MPRRILVISNPPHGAVDVHVCAPVLGLIPAELNLKVHYAVPEIWLAEEDAEEALRAAEVLSEANARVVPVGSDALVAVPGQRLIREFTFGPTALSVTLREGRVEIPYAHPMLLVHCVPQPPPGGTGAPPIQVDPDGTTVSEASAFLDFYLRAKTGLVRLALYSELVDFSGLAERETSSHARNMALILDDIRERFVGVHVDGRLEKMQLRRRSGVGTPAPRENTRKGFSFASPGLHELLQAVAPSLLDIGQSELSSRLAYLTTRSAAPAGR